MSKLTNNTTSLEQILEDLKTKATPSGGTNTNDATATASDLLEGKTAYVKGQKITGTIITRTQATPSITINSSGLITASATQTAGYVAAGTKSATKQLTTKGATTWTPKTTNQTIASSTYLTGTQTIKGDSNLVAANIKSGVSIFGVNGTYTGSTSGGGEDEDLPASVVFTIEIFEPGDGDLIYVNASGVKTTTTWTGMMPMVIDDCRPNSFIILFGSNANVNCSGGIEEIAYGVNQGDYLSFSVFFIGTTAGSIA